MLEKQAFPMAQIGWVFGTRYGSRPFTPIPTVKFNASVPVAMCH
jgi:hypothetical protein